MPSDPRSWLNLAISSEIRPDSIRNRIAIKAQPIGVAESVLHLVLVRTKSDGRWRWVKLPGDRVIPAC